jgi:hypothetical protein
MIVNGSSSQITGTSLQNSGAMTFTANGSIYVYSYTSASFTNLSSGVINFQADGTPFYLGGGATGLITNYGTIEKTGGSSAGTTVNWGVDFKNASTVIS